MSERRFYIHEGSIRTLCDRFQDQDAVFLPALGLSVASRIARHHLLINGEHLGLVPAATFGRGALALEQASCQRLSYALRQLVYAPAEMGQRGATHVVLGASESVAATCWENGYFTFATGPRSARTMFEETGSLRALRAELRKSADPDHDLTMISGGRLFPYSPGMPVGTNTLSTYRALTSRPRMVSAPRSDPAGVVADAAEFFEQPKADRVAFKLFSEFVSAAGSEVQRLFERLSPAPRGVSGAVPIPADTSRRRRS